MGKNKYRLDTKEIIETCCLTNHLSKAVFWLKHRSGQNETRGCFCPGVFFFFFSPLP